MAALDPAPWIGFNRRFEPGLARLRSKVPAKGELDLSIELHHPPGPGAPTWCPTTCSPPPART